MKKIFFLLIVLIGILEGCKKYEEGPCISFRSAEKRIYGTYTMTKYTVDGTDSLILYNDSLGLIFSFFYDDVNSYDVCYIVSNRKDGGWANLYWHWILYDKNQYLNINSAVGSTYGTVPFGINKLPIWELLRMTNKEIKMKTNYNGKEYIVELEED